MSVRPTRLTAAAVAGLALAMVGPMSAQAHTTVEEDLAATKSALNPYEDEYTAISHGYQPTDDCVESPEGVMGYHYVKPELIDHEIDPMTPEVLVYQPDGSGGRKLVAVEYYYVDADQDLDTDDDRPSLFGRPFDGPSPGQAPGLPINFTLHVWFWQDNPDGLFAAWNPAGSCQV